MRITLTKAETEDAIRQYLSKSLPKHECYSNLDIDMPQAVDDDCYIEVKDIPYKEGLPDAE